MTQQTYDRHPFFLPARAAGGGFGQALALTYLSLVIVNFGPGKTIGKVLMKTSGNFYKFEKACMVNLNVII